MVNKIRGLNKRWAVIRWLKSLLLLIGIRPQWVYPRVSIWSLRSALKEQGLTDMAASLRELVPDISSQEDRALRINDERWELKVRGVHAFQCALMLKAIEKISSKDIMVVDIGDSAGTHMLYLRGLTENKLNVDSISVNLEEISVNKIKNRGLKAVQCRAEELDIGNKKVDLFTSFEMVEHLHNPALFFYRLSKREDGNLLLVTVPYRQRSRVALYFTRAGSKGPVFAGEEHIFELSPDDWSALMWHSGWKAVYSQVYYQYPKRWFALSWLLSLFWKMYDFEGFWGVILERDKTFSELYQSWEE